MSASLLTIRLNVMPEKENVLWKKNCQRAAQVHCTKFIRGLSSQSMGPDDN